jgi:hypothetical protein
MEVTLEYREPSCAGISRSLCVSRWVVVLLLLMALVGCSSATQGIRRGPGQGRLRLAENVQRGVAKDNPLGSLFHDAATKQWGQLHPDTGN